MKTINDEVAAQAQGQPAEMEQLAQIERQRSHLWTTGLIVLISASLVIVALSFWTDALPDAMQDAFGFPGARVSFLVLSLAFGAYVIQRERDFRALTRRLVEENARAARLAEADRRRADLVARTTHELKTPLTSVLGYATILRKREATLTPEQRGEFIDVMERQGRRILQLIEEMLQHSRLNEGLTRLQRVPLDLHGVVKRVADEFAVGRDRPVEVSMPDADLGLYGDPAALEHVLTNLLDNAIKYSPDGSVVRVEVAEADGSVLLRVIDRGDGISAEDLATIFERYQQGGNARGGASVGLGLFIVRSLVEAQGGSVWAESTVGAGTTFTVALPRRRRDD